MPIMVLILLAAAVALYFSQNARAAEIEEQAMTDIDTLGIKPKNGKYVTEESPFDAIIISASSETQVPVNIIKAVIQQESNWNEYAKNPSDPSTGLMQITPPVAYDFGLISSPSKNQTEDAWETIREPQNNILCGANLLARLYNMFDSWDMALQAYNAGAGRIKGGFDNSKYSRSVLSYFKGYENL